MAKIKTPTTKEEYCPLHGKAKNCPVVMQLTAERNVLAMLAKDNPQFFNPTGIFRAKALRDEILKGCKKKL